MSTSALVAVCEVCQEEFAIVLEYLSRDEAMKTIQNTYCPECDSFQWHFTDEVER